jgi:hypothetical protein
MGLIFSALLLAQVKIAGSRQQVHCLVFEAGKTLGSGLG